MYPVIKQLFHVEFGDEEMFYKTITFENYTVTFIYINIDHTTDYLENSREVYDKDGADIVPMFSIVTLGYDGGDIRPYYTTLYGTFSVYGYVTSEEKIACLTEILQESIEMYKQNKAGYQQN